MALDYPSLVLASSPLFYTRFDEETTPCPDSSGNGRGWGGSGNMLKGEEPIVADSLYSAYWGGASSSFDMGDAAWMDVENITVEVWLKPNYTRAGGKVPVVIVRGVYNAATFDPGFWGLSYQDSGALRFWVSVGGSVYDVDGASITDPDAATHVVGTYDGSHARLYINGVLDAEVAIAGLLDTGAAPIRLFRGTNSSFTRYSGWIDELAVYPAALTDEEVHQHYQTGAGAVDPLAVTATAVGGRAVITWDPEGSTNDFRLYRRPAPDGVGAGDWVLSAVIPDPVAEHLPYTDLTSSPCEEWEYTVREVEDGEEQPQYVPDTVAIPCLSADTISATLEGALLARIDVTSPSDTATQRTLQASASSDFASFVEIPQEGGPLPAVLYDVTGEAGARRYYRTAVTDGLSTAYSNVVYLDFPAEPGPAKPVLTVEAVGVNFVVVSLSAPAVPAGHTIAAIELAIYFDGDLVRNETIPIADPDDPGQPWREQAIEEIYPSEETFTVTGRWISDSTPDRDPTFSPGPYSDPKTFTLLDIPEDDPEEDDPEEAGQVEHLELSDEWPIPLYSLRLALTLPEIEHLSSVQVGVTRSGSHVRTQIGSAKYPIRQFGAMLPGATYSFAALWTYVPPDSLPRRAASRVSLVTIPLANVPPYFKIESGVSFTEPTTIEFDQHQHPSFEGLDVITEGAWPVEITRDGATWVRLTDDARIEPYEFDPASYTSGYAQFRVRNEPAEGAPSRWRTSPPVYLHPPEYYWRHAGDELTVDLFETGGSGEWSQVDEAEDRRVRYVGGPGTGGYAALKHVGQPRTFEVITVGQWATGRAEHWMYGFHAEMYAHWGVGAFLRDDPYTALTARLGPSRAALGQWRDRHLGEAGAPWWQSGIRYGLGSMRPLIGRYGPASGADPGARTSQYSGSSAAQWLGGAASVVGVPLSPWYTVRARYTLLETELDGSHRIRVQMQLWGPESDRSAGFSLSYEYRGIEWPCGPPGLLAVSGSNNVIDFQSITVLAEDYGTCPLPEGTDFLASASGSPCDPLIAIFWRHGHGGS